MSSFIKTIAPGDRVGAEISNPLLCNPQVQDAAADVFLRGSAYEMTIANVTGPDLGRMKTGSVIEVQANNEKVKGRLISLTRSFQRAIDDFSALSEYSIEAKI